jgi:hypothetical protein
MKNFLKIAIVVCSLHFAPRLPAEDVAPNELNDSLLNKLVGDWNVERRMGSGRTAKNTVHAEWVLHHQFLELHYRDTATPPKYEAIILLGYDGVGRRYICHWADVFGGSYSTDGFAERDESSNAFELKFEFHDGPLTNRYAFDPKTGGWTSTIRQAEKGEWKLFCEDTFTRANGRTGP